MAVIEIDDGVLDALRTRASEKGFRTVEEYVRFVLEQLADRIRVQNGGTGTPSPDEEKTIQDRLRSLGYLE